MRKLKITGVLRAVLLVLTVTGILLFFLLTAMDRRKLQRTVDDTIAFARARIQRYEDFNTNDKVKSLIRLLDKSTELSRVIAAEGTSERRVCCDRGSAASRVSRWVDRQTKRAAWRWWRAGSTASPRPPALRW